MKKIIYLLFILPLLGILGGCDSDDPIVFDHEQPQFEIKSNAILLEVIMPQGSTATDEYYIVGDFNGGVEEAVGDLEWQLEKSSGNDMKWGIYLNPSSFKNGKTLANGFTFYSKKQGAERSVFNKEVTHTLDAGVGTRTNVWVDRWEAYFGNVQKDYYTIYVDDQSEWDALTLHYWGAIDGEGVTGTEWPGLESAGTETINGVDYTYFELPKELNGKTINTIFNNNGGGKQFDAMFGFLVERDIYVKITGSGYEEVDPNDVYNGFTVYVDNQTTWTALALYTWGDIEVGGWPGLQPTGTKEVEGVMYTYFRMGEGANNMAVNLIFNNNDNGTQLGDIPVTLDRDFYFRITDTGSKEVDPFATTGTVHKIYIEDNSGWSAIALHYWGDDITGTSWPGIAPAGTEEIGGVTYTYFEMPETLDGKAINFILNNNNNGEQFNGPYITLDRDFYFRITNSSYEEISFRVYVDNQSGWPAFAFYSWGDFELGAWPGITPAGTEVINSVTYSYFEMGVAATGKSVNLIFNNTVGGDGGQFDGPYVTINRNYYYQITASSATEVTIN